ncbi:MAG: hypothetical protein QOJ59_944 [Thermomicrobiales bacterium]|nr:hypothetical protein [Thermomicrobiales bacterium]
MAQGPFDDTITTPQDVAEAARAPGVAAEERRPLPGGKALLRLVELLETAGYTNTASAVIDRAVPEEEADTVRALVAQISPAAAGETPEGEATPASRRRRGRTGRAAEESEADAGAPEIEAIAQTYMEVGEALGPPTPTGPQWRSVGPWTVTNGQTYGSSRVNVSGRVSALAVDPANPAHVLAGAANGGVWESRDRGASWSPRTDYAATTTVGALAFDPRDSRLVYCGTGEGDWWSWLGAGILRSTNGGSTWATLCTAPFVGQGFYNLIVDPADGRHLLAATTGGLYVSTDSGLTWTRRRTAQTWSIAIAPAGGPTAEILAASSDGLWRSTDGGTTWNAVTLPGSPGGFDRLAVSIARSNPGVAYAWGARGSTGYLWRRAGGTWSSVAIPPGVSVNQAWYDWYVAAAPDRDTQVYCGAIEIHRGDLSGTTWTWRNLTNKGATGQSIHPDQHSFAFEPGRPDTIYAGNDGGVYRSPDRGITWQHCNNGLVISEVEYLAQDYGSSRWLIAGTQDNGTIRWTGPGTWEHVADGDGGDCGVNRATPATVFHTFQRGGQPLQPERSTARGNWGSWGAIFPSAPAGDAGLFYPPMECSATAGDTIAIAGGALYVSRNNGTAWTRLGFPSAAIASAVFIPNANAVYVGTTDGRVFRTGWTGSSWSALTALTTPRAGATVSDLYVDPNNVQRLWATFRTIGGGRVYRSDNGGSTWLDRTAGLPGLPMNAIEVDPGNANRVWVGADLGVYQSLNGGTTWADFSSSLPNAFIGDLVFQPHARVLRAGTRNRGVWEIPVDGWMTRPVCGVQWTGNLAANEERRWFTFNWPATWHIVWTVMPTTPQPGAPQVTWKVQVERANAEYVTYWISVRNLTAVPLTFEGCYCILSRY